MKERNFSIDILKFIGIFSIILAHSQPNAFVTQIRSFDVPLLVMISGLLGAITYRKDLKIYEYFKKRIIRLVIPTWLFLTIFFVVVFIAKRFSIQFNIVNLRNIEWFSVERIIRSYLLLDGIGYVWIIRVYVMCAFMIPIILKLKEKIGIKYCTMIVLTLYILYEIIYLYVGNNISIINYILYYLIPYGIVYTYIGIIIKDLSDKKILLLSITSLIIFGVVALSLLFINGRFIVTNEYKYPPRLYYIVYSLLISLLLYYFIDRKNVRKINERLNNSFIIFVSSHSMWIYLWHIPFIFVLKIFNEHLYWGIKYIILLTGGILLTYIQTKILKILKIRNKTLLSILNG